MRVISIAIATRSLSAPNKLMLGMLLCVGTWAKDLEASQFDYNLRYRAEYSDNVTRIPDEREGQSELINSAIAGFSFLENTSTFNARVIGSATYSHYYNNLFENQTTFSLDAYGEAYVVQRTLSWVAADGFRRLQVDPLLPDTPANRQNSNAWATGPNVYLRFGAVDTVSVEGRYGQSWVENLDIDNDRYSYAARWAHRVTARGTFSLNYEHLDVDFENDVANADIARQNYFFRANIRDARNDLTFDLGRTRIDRDGYPPNRNWLIHLTVSMQPDTSSRIGVHYRREYSDTGGELLPAATSSQATTGSGALSLAADVVASEPFYLEDADLYYTRQASTFPWTTRVFYRDIDYEVSPTDRQERGLLLDVRYLFSSTGYVQLLTIYTILLYDQMMREDKDSNIGVTFAYRMTSNLQASLNFLRFGRRSTAPGQDYTDDRVGLTITYSSRPVGR